MFSEIPLSTLQALLLSFNTTKNQCGQFNHDWGSSLFCVVGKAQKGFPSAIGFSTSPLHSCSSWLVWLCQWKVSQQYDDRKCRCLCTFSPAAITWDNRRVELSPAAVDRWHKQSMQSFGATIPAIQLCHLFWSTMDPQQRSHFGCSSAGWGSWRSQEKVQHFPSNLPPHYHPNLHLASETILVALPSANFLTY